MLSLRLFDTLSQSLRPFVPRTPGEATVYCCGPTTYDVAHVGHARAALAPDILVRHLRAEGMKVTYARNVTDVDDKILARSKENGEDPLALSARMTVLYQEDIAALGCVTPDVEPRVSGHIPEIIAIIETLIANGAAYVAEMKGPGKDGVKDVYYAVRAFDGYGKLSKRKIEELQVGARIAESEDKKDPLDFALWKGCADAAYGWDSPWGRGRPGWHIECSAMSEKHLGYGFDIHTGGMDLVFPHHENEIAQSEAAHPGQGDFCRTWIHNGFVNVDKEKMAKSLGNFVTVRDVYERNDPEALRYFLLGVHYRGPIAFDTEKLDSGRVVFPGIVEAERRVDYLYSTVERLRDLAGDANTSGLPKILPNEVSSALELAKRAEGELRAALDDDLNTPVALSVIAEIAKMANELADAVQKRKKDTALQNTGPAAASALQATLVKVVGRIGLLRAEPAAYAARTRDKRLAMRGLTPAAIEAKIAARAAARAAKDFAKGDALRAELEAMGVAIADGPAGTTWKIGP
jgi:cysteinyl-tRNA synthetase